MIADTSRCMSTNRKNSAIKQNCRKFELVMSVFIVHISYSLMDYLDGVTPNNVFITQTSLHKCSLYLSKRYRSPTVIITQEFICQFELLILIFIFVFLVSYIFFLPQNLMELQSQLDKVVRHIETRFFE